MNCESFQHDLIIFVCYDTLFIILITISYHDFITSMNLSFYLEKDKKFISNINRTITRNNNQESQVLLIIIKKSAIIKRCRIIIHFVLNISFNVYDILKYFLLFYSE
jgi:hypothetical protein